MFLFLLDVFHEGLNDHEELLLFNLAVNKDESTETGREVRRKEDVELPDVRFDLNKNSDAECRVTGGSVFARRKRAPQSTRSKERRMMGKRKKKKTSLKIHPALNLRGRFEGILYQI